LCQLSLFPVVLAVYILAKNPYLVYGIAKKGGRCCPSSLVWLISDKVDNRNYGCRYMRRKNQFYKRVPIFIYRLLLLYAANNGVEHNRDNYDRLFKNFHSFLSLSSSCGSCASSSTSCAEGVSVFPVPVHADRAASRALLLLPL